jgi:capsular exopolysaccharide synthesis family protein
MDRVYNVSDSMSDPVKEAYEMLKTNISLYDFGRKIKTLTVTSYRAGEGKTTTAYNLALTMAHSGMRVLFIDADLHKPELVKNLKGVNFKGLSNYLIGNLTLSDITNATSLKGFYFISCGVMPGNTLGLLNSPRFSELIRETSKLYDVIIFDTPPLGSVADSLIVAAQTDGTLFVIQPGKVSCKNMQMITDRIKKSNIKLLGVVLNNIPKRDYRSYYREYDYYGAKKKYSRQWRKGTDD